MDLFDGQDGFEKPEGVLRDDVRFIFDHWKKVMKKTGKTALDEKRKLRIMKAVKLYGDIQFLCRAIDGCAMDEWYMGRNDRKKAYNDIEHIFKNASNIERFEELARLGKEKKEAARKVKVSKQPWEVEGITYAQWFEKTYGKKPMVPVDILKKFKIKVDNTAEIDIIIG